jgi:TonB family protein
MPTMYRLILLLASVAGALAAADMTGKWIGTMEANGTRLPVYLTMNLRDGKLTGFIATGQDTKQVPLEMVEAEGDQLGFQVPDNAKRLVKFRLSLAENRLSGESAVEGKTSKVVLARPTVAVDGRVLGGGTGRGGGGPLSSSVTGSNQGVREGAYRVGGGVSAPVLIHKTEPEYTEEARAAKYQGTVLLYVEIDRDGNATNIKVQRSLGLGLDEKAVEAVKQWKFKPGYKDGTPVTVQATIEVNFRL